MSTGYSAQPVFFLFFFQAEDGIRDLVRSRGLGDVYKRQTSAREGTSEIRRPIIKPRVSTSGAHTLKRIDEDLSLIHI